MHAHPAWILRVRVQLHLRYRSGLLRLHSSEIQPLHVMFCGANALGQTERVPLGRLSDRFRCFGWYRH